MADHDSVGRRLGPFRTQLGWSAALTALFAVGLALPGIVFFSEPADYTILHTVLEFASMAISLMIVALAWNLRQLAANSQIMLIGWFSLGVLIVDLAHTLSFPGMPDFATESTAQKAITFWLAGRIIAAVGFLVLALVPTRHWSPRLWVPGVVVVTLGALLLVWIGIFHTQWVPTFFVPGEGLTTLKRVLEYGLSATYALAALLLLRRARRENSTELAWLAAAAWTLTLAELYFTLYVNVADVFNLLGHVLKVIAYGMVYRAVFVAGVQDPYRRLARETSLLRSLIDSVPDLISFTDTDGRVLGVNRAFGNRLRIAPDDAVGQRLAELTPDADRHRSRLHGSGDRVERFEETLTSDAGLVEVYDTLRTPYYSSSGASLGLIEISRDVTAQKAAEERIHHLALYDHLTGLPNRVLLTDLATELFADAAQAGRTQALIFLDLDDFKTVNDTVGHRVGDLLLRETAERVSAAVGPDVLVARLGGDEFAVLATRHSLDDTADLARAIIDSLDQPYRIEQYDLALSASAGIAMYPTDGSTFDELAVRADAAMYRAKREGRHTYRFFSGDMLLNAAERLDLLSSLRHAVDRDELVVQYQPQVSLADGRIVGVEALVRWAHPEQGLLAPDRFIGLAEESGLILPIGEQVLRRALTDAGEWDRAGCQPVRVSVNLSAVQFVQTDLPERIRRTLLQTQFPAERLDLEITETVAMANPDMASVTIEGLHRMGVTLSIDDFGTGYSSMAYLKRFHVDTLKIDKSFVEDLGRDPDDEAIVTAIIHMARTLRCSTVAEGVETRAQRDFLTAQGCDIAQGYHLHRPMDADAVRELLQPVLETT